MEGQQRLERVEVVALDQPVVGRGVAVDGVHFDQPVRHGRGGLQGLALVQPVEDGHGWASFESMLMSL